MNVVRHRNIYLLYLNESQQHLSSVAVGTFFSFAELKCRIHCIKFWEISVNFNVHSADLIFDVVLTT